MTFRSVVPSCVVGSMVAGGLASYLAGCGAAPAATNASPGALGPQAEAVVHEPCDPKGHRLESADTRGDGKSVVTKVFDGARELCRITDINHDGKADLYEYFDASGAVRRREADYDANGTIDAVELYEGGKLVKREYDTTGQHRVDTWDFFDKASGKRVRRERDTTNDGRVDEWWTWEGDKITIAVDRNGDGRPDPEATIVLDDKTGEAVRSPSGGGPAASPPAASAAPAAPEGPPPPVAPSATPPVASASAPPPPAAATTHAGASK